MLTNNEEITNNVVNCYLFVYSNPIRRMPPPKRASSSFSRRSSSVMSKPPSAQEKQALSNMFKRIESTDSALVKCSKCALMIKSCLMRDHLETKCEKTSKRRLTEDEIKQELLEIRSQRQPQLTQVKQR